MFIVILTDFHLYWIVELWMVKCDHRWHWCLWWWNLVQLIRGHWMSSFVILSDSGEKLVKGQLWLKSHRSLCGVIWLLPSMSYETIFVLVSYFLLFHLCTWKKLGVINFGHIWKWVMTFDLLPLILNNGIVSSEMRSQVALMPVY